MLEETLFISTDEERGKEIQQARRESSVQGSRQPKANRVATKKANKESWGPNQQPHLAFPMHNLASYTNPEDRVL